MKKHSVIRQEWLESERGWGCRPDGYTLHLSEEDREKFISDYWDRMPDQVPDEYSRPQGEPKLVKVDDDTHQKLQIQLSSEKPIGISKHGLWF